MADNLSGTITIKIIASDVLGKATGQGDIGKQIARQVSQITGGEKFLPFPKPPFALPKNMWPSGMYGLAGFNTQQTSQAEQKKEEREYNQQLINEAKIVNRIQNENKPFIKGLGKYLPIIAGVGGIAGILAHSKIISQTSSAMAQLLGALVDVILMPLIPILIPVLKGLAFIITQAMQFFKDPIGYLEKLWKNFIDWLKNQFKIEIPKDIREKEIPGTKITVEDVIKTLPKLVRPQGLDFERVLTDINEINKVTKGELSKMVAIGAAGAAVGAVAGAPFAGIGAGPGAILGGTAAIITYSIQKGFEEISKEGLLKWLMPYGNTINVNVSGAVGSGVLTPEEFGRRTGQGLITSLEEAENRGH